MTSPISRRSVLKGIALGATSPVWIRFAEPALAAPNAVANATRHLLVVFLRGGNDPLRTVAPMGHAALSKLRPNVGLRDGDMFAMGNGYGINKLLPSFHEAWRNGHLAVVQQTGPVNTDFSHGTATRKWESGHPDERFSTGWLGRYLDATPAVGPVRAAAFGDTLPLTLTGENSDALSLRSLAGFGFNDRRYADAQARRNALVRMASTPAPRGSALEMMLRSQRELIDASGPLTTLATTALNGKPTDAQSVAQLFAAGLGTEVAFLNVGGFDTHTDERRRHAAAIGDLDETVGGFLRAAASRGVADRSAVLVVSEFGRRVYENQSGGTDHGYGTSVFLLGAGVRGGMYGPDLDLSQLDDGNLPVRVDIRSVYASVLGSWLRTNPEPILGGSFGTLPLFR